MGLSLMRASLHIIILISGGRRSKLLLVESPLSGVSEQSDAIIVEWRVVVADDLALKMKQCVGSKIADIQFVFGIVERQESICMSLQS